MPFSSDPDNPSSFFPFLHLCFGAGFIAPAILCAFPTNSPFLGKIPPPHSVRQDGIPVIEDASNPPGGTCKPSRAIRPLRATRPPCFSRAPRPIRRFGDKAAICKRSASRFFAQRPCGSDNFETPRFAECLVKAKKTGFHQHKR